MSHTSHETKHMIQQITNIVSTHKSHGYHAIFNGWHIRKFSLYRSCKEFFHNTLCFGVQHEFFVDIIPCGEVECAHCHSVLPLEVSEKDYMFPRNMAKIPWGCGDIILCGICANSGNSRLRAPNTKKTTVYELRARTPLDINYIFDMFQTVYPSHQPHFVLSCISLSTKAEILRFTEIYMRDTLLLISDPTGIQTNVRHCIMLPGGLLPSHVYLRLLTKRVIRRWRRFVQKRLSQKVAFVLYKSIPGLDQASATILGRIGAIVL